METLENHGDHGNRRCGIETVANHIEIMETMENLRKHRPRSGGTSDPNLEVQANQIWRYKRTPARKGRKVGTLKRRVRSQLARWEMKNCTPLWREAHFQVKMYKHTKCGPLLAVETSKKCTPLWREAHVEVNMYKTHHSRTTFGSWDVQKVHAVVARSTFPNQNVQTHQVRTTFGSWDVGKCTPLWREAHLEVKRLKTPRVRATFGSSDVEKVHVVVARSTFWNQNNTRATRGSDHFWRLRCPFASQQYTTLHNSTLHYTTLHYTTFHYTPLHYTTVHYITLNDTAPQIAR